MDTITIKAPAKINLGLDITGRRPDGYHTVDMVNISVSLYDEITITKNGGLGLRIFCADPDVPCDEHNLCAKAAAALAEAAGIPGFDADITIIKNIPTRAGLGGGSSDAAATIKGLLALFDPDISDDELSAAALRVGADVPYCLKGGIMRAGGIGEILSPIDCITEFSVCILMPDNGGVSTPEAYKAVDEITDLIHPDIDGLIHGLKKGDFDAILDNTGNVFQQALPSDDTECAITLLKDAGCFTACLSGSGAAVFGLVTPGINIDREQLVRGAGKDYRVFTGLSVI